MNRRKFAECSQKKVRPVLTYSDEAHHVPAQTWTQILMNLPQRCHVLFTATPFRLDRKEILGEIVYDYPLSRAYEEGIFGEIKFIPVEDGADKHIRLAQYELRNQQS
ncbi:MAG: DEAD/DEAH box helicase family protein [Clostridiales bacterium]|nr:DEAD/DEAH box helicase family protein [Clostridiales bacterium]